MRDTVKTPPPDRTRDAEKNRERNPGAGRWIWIGALVAFALVPVFRFTGMMDDRAHIDAMASATISADEAIVNPEADAVEIQAETDPEPDVETGIETIPSTPPE